MSEKVREISDLEKQADYLQVQRVAAELEKLRIKAGARGMITVFLLDKGADITAYGIHLSGELNGSPPEVLIRAAQAFMEQVEKDQPQSSLVN